LWLDNVDETTHGTPPLAVKSILPFIDPVAVSSPINILAKIGAGSANNTETESEHPYGSVTTTEYVPVDKESIVVEVEPLDQRVEAKAGAFVDNVNAPSLPPLHEIADSLTDADKL
jgi:hypothetical protein